MIYEWQEARVGGSHEKNAIVLLAVTLLASAALARPSGQVATATDWQKVIGIWSLTVEADSYNIYLTLSLELNEGLVKGKMTEQSGMIPEVPLEAVEFDNENLKFAITAPSPPDGLNKVWKASFKVFGDKLEGAFFNEELGIAAAATGTRENKL